MFKTLFRLSAALVGGVMIYTVGKAVGTEEAKRSEKVEDNNCSQEDKESK